MKHILLVVCLFVAIAEANAQYPKHVVQLRDKSHNTYSLTAPSQFLSARALQRRTRYNIPLDSTDLPVTQQYIDSIRAVPDVTVLSASKWLNQVLIYSTDAAALNQINSFSFVKSTVEVGNRHVNTGNSNKFKETVTPLAASPTPTHKTTADAFNYGNGYNQIHIHEGEYLHNKGFHGEGMLITMLDAGFYHYETITAFDSARLNGQILGVRDFVDFDNSVIEDDIHGMHCLSTILTNWPGQMVGSAPKASFWLVRTEKVSSEFPVEEHNWVVGAEFADSVGSDMISSSLGYNTFDDPIFDHDSTQFYHNATMATRGATLAAKKGILIMNSAGNEGNNSSWKYLTFPADADSVCAVGAVDYNGNIAGFSSRGFPGKVKPNVVSVGVQTVIAEPSNMPSAGSGTSYACPNLAGLVACLWQAFPQLNNMQIIAAVQQSADRHNTPTNAYGYGIPNFRIAYGILDHMVNPTPPVDATNNNDWLVAIPNAFVTNLMLSIKPLETGKAELRLIDAIGRTVARTSFEGTQGTITKLEFNGTQGLAKGVYFLQYISSNQKRVVSLMKG